LRLSQYAVLDNPLDIKSWHTWCQNSSRSVLLSNFGTRRLFITVSNCEQRQLACSNFKQLSRCGLIDVYANIVKNNIIQFSNRNVVYYCRANSRLQLEMLKTQYRQQANWINPVEIKNDKLFNIIDSAYKPGAKVGSGSTSDAIRLEIIDSGRKVGNRRHLIKGKDLIVSLERLLKSDKLSSHERMIAENVRLDLLDAFGEKLWYSQTNMPKNF
jgi:hypothetical protein